MVHQPPNTSGLLEPPCYLGPVVIALTNRLPNWSPTSTDCEQEVWNLTYCTNPPRPFLMRTTVLLTMLALASAGIRVISFPSKTLEPSK